MLLNQYVSCGPLASLSDVQPGFSVVFSRSMNVRDITDCLNHSVGVATRHYCLGESLKLILLKISL